MTAAGTEEFDMRDFLPYLLNQAAEASSLAFQRVYKDRYGMLRTEWRVLFHLGCYGAMTAKEINIRSRTHKTKISRAVKALEERRFLTRKVLENDRRQELLELTKAGQAVCAELRVIAQKYDEALAAQFTQEEQEVLRSCLRRLAKF